jgi:HPt (histidine-containing phosphotransfer) domain-containing protein
MAGVVLIITQEVTFFSETLGKYLERYGHNVVTIPFSKREVSAEVGKCDVALVEVNKSKQTTAILDIVFDTARIGNLSMCVAGYSDDIANLAPQISTDLVSRTFKRPCDIVEAAREIGALVDQRRSKDPIARLEEAGINTRTGLQFTGDNRDFYLEILEGFAREAADRIDRLDADYDNADWDDYAIGAHSLKGSSRTIGATDLGELAFSLEMAAREHREADIRNEHDAFISAYRQTVDDICVALGRESALQSREGHPSEVESQKRIANELSSISRDEFVQHLSDARTCLETFEVEQAESYVREATERVLDGSPTTPLLADALRCLEEFDVDGATDILSGLIDSVS